MKSNKQGIWRSLAMIADFGVAQLASADTAVCNGKPITSGNHIVFGVVVVFGAWMASEPHVLGFSS